MHVYHAENITGGLSRPQDISNMTFRSAIVWFCRLLFYLRDVFATLWLHLMSWVQLDKLVGVCGQVTGQVTLLCVVFIKWFIMKKRCSPGLCHRKTVNNWPSLCLSHTVWDCPSTVHGHLPWCDVSNYHFNKLHQIHLDLDWGFYTDVLLIVQTNWYIVILYRIHRKIGPL